MSDTKAVLKRAFGPILREADGEPGLAVLIALCVFMLGALLTFAGFALLVLSKGLVLIPAAASVGLYFLFRWLND